MNDSAAETLSRDEATLGFAPVSPVSPARGLARLLRARVLEQARGLRDCQLRVIDADGDVMLGTPAADPAQTLHVTVRVRDAAFYRQLSLGGSVGAGESFMDGYWDCSDLTALVRILVRNRELLDAMEGGFARFAGWLMRGAHAFARNTRLGSRRNIAAHYDLGNALFELFLDDSMMYSAAIFARPDESLEVAQRRKLDRICRKLQLSPDDHVVEIGSGWGGFAIHAARHYGCRVTTTTISREQHDYAAKRIAAAGLGERITLLQRDYRDLEGRYDKLVSIEMVEAIGHQYLDTYFARCASLLKDDGMALIQAINIEDHRYEQALDAVDFIQRHVFPGSFIPSVAALQSSVARSSDLRLFNLEEIGPSYALTLRHWRERFNARLDAVRAQGYPERFVRMWNYYLSYCEGGFIERSIGVAQLLLTRPRCRRPQFAEAS
ncbi:MAG: cyclopropane-fatty-acyl-phospholipid synthase family protein [Pseudomonadota bacterium]